MNSIRDCSRYTVLFLFITINLTNFILILFSPPLDKKSPDDPSNSKHGESSSSGHFRHKKRQPCKFIACCLIQRIYYLGFHCYHSYTIFFRVCQGVLKKYYLKIIFTVGKVNLFKNIAIPHFADNHLFLILYQSGKILWIRQNDLHLFQLIWKSLNAFQGHF